MHKIRPRNYSSFRNSGLPLRYSYGADTEKIFFTKEEDTHIDSKWYLVALLCSEHLHEPIPHMAPRLSGCATADMFYYNMVRTHLKLPVKLPKIKLDEGQRQRSRPLLPTQGKSGKRSPRPRKVRIA